MDPPNAIFSSNSGMNCGARGLFGLSARTAILIELRQFTRICEDLEAFAGPTHHLELLEEHPRISVLSTHVPFVVPTAEEFSM